MPLALTVDGLTIESVEEVRESLDSAMKSAFGPQIDTTDGAVLGQINGIMAERFTVLQEGLQAVHNSTNPDAATGAALTALCALTGTVPHEATQGTVTLTLTGDDATSVPAGSAASVVDTGEAFETDEDATLALLDDWAITTAYAVGDRVTNASRAYVCTDAGTSAGSGGPTTQDADITDGSVIWDYIGEGDSAVDVAATAAETGPIVATSGSITVIDTPVSGWESVRNLTDAVPGSNAESDEDLRVRREVELQAAGTSPQKAIRTDIADVPGVTAVRVFMNVTDVTDADGVPPHSVEVLVQGPDTVEFDQSIWDQLLISVAAGIRTHGDEVGASEDDEGISQVMKFSRPDEINIYVDVTLIKDPDEYPADGDDQVRAAIVAYGQAQTTGRNVVSSALIAQIFSIAGVLEVSSCYIDDAPSPASSATIAIALRELAVYDTSRIDVASSDGTP